MIGHSLTIRPMSPRYQDMVEKRDVFEDQISDHKMLHYF